MIPSAEYLAQLDREIEECRQRELELRRLRAREEAKRGIYRCVVCRDAYVCPEDGEDTCADCRKRI